MSTGIPIVSVLMTAYNREKYLAEAIESVLASTLTDFELIIVDDGSTDNTVAIAKKYEQQDGRVKVYVNEKNLGDYYNRNKAATYAKGKYIKYLDSDDYLYPHGLSILVSRMEAQPQAGIGLAKRSLKDRPFPVLLAPNDCYRQYFIDGIGIFNNAPTSSIINREFFLKIGSFSGLNQYGDFEFWLKAATHSPILLIEGDVTWDRDHPYSEKYKDGVYDKFKLHYNISLAALCNKDNPLNKFEKKLAIGKLKYEYKKFMIRTLLTGKLFEFLKLLKNF